MELVFSIMLDSVNDFEKRETEERNHWLIHFKIMSYFLGYPHEKIWFDEFPINSIIVYAIKFNVSDNNGWNKRDSTLKEH